MLPWWPRRCADTPMVAPNPQIRAAGFAAFAIVAAFAGFVVVAAIGEGPQLAPLGPRTLILAGLLLVTGTAAVVVTLRERREPPERRLRRAITMNDEIYRTIAVDSGEMILVGDEDGRNEYASPATSELLGIPAAELRGLGWQRFIHAEDLPAVMEAIARLRGGAKETVCLFRLRADGGEERWMEARCRRSRPAGPTGRGFVVWVARDVTAHKRKEQALEAEKERLEVMVGTDALTGLANRRRFDEVRTKEWRRACREETAISLLVVDVDHFKRYNDTYGHAEGDRCLAAVAGVIAASMRRPADFCARHGGEEFVVLLPRTDGDGARHVGEAIRAGVAALAMPHRRSEAGIVTVSVGVAACARPHEAASDGLFEAADRQMYRAKAAGRDRVA